MSLLFLLLTAGAALAQTSQNDMNPGMGSATGLDADDLVTHPQLSGSLRQNGLICYNLEKQYTSLDNQGREIWSTWPQRCLSGNDITEGLGCSCIGGAVNCPTVDALDSLDAGTCKEICYCDPDPPKPGASVSALFTPQDVPVSPFATCPSTCSGVGTCSSDSGSSSGSSTNVNNGNNVQASCLCTALHVVWFFWFRGTCAQKAKPSFPRLRSRQITEIGTGSIRGNPDGQVNYTMPAGTSTTSSAPGSAATGAQVNASAIDDNSILNSTIDIGGPTPYACNSSYVSYACADAPDGIVYEPLTNWLGALLPDDADENNPPEVPQQWREIFGYTSDPNHAALQQPSNGGTS